MLLKGNNVLVTGAARGIGLAVARKIASEGAFVLMADVDASVLADECKTLANDGLAVEAVSLDVTDRLAIRATLGRLMDDAPLDALINNAAILDVAHTSTIDDAQFARVLDVNLAGALRVTQEALPHLRRAAAPAVVNTVSTQAFYAVPSSAAYAVAKGGLMMLTRTMAVDLGEEGIRVNAVAPGFIDTRMAQMPDGGHEHQEEDFRRHYIDAGRIPLRRAGKPEDCAGAFVFLISDLSHYVTGQALFVDGGLTATY